MIDRTALLLPRFRASQNSYTQVLDDTLHHLRIGYAVEQIGRARKQFHDDRGAEINDLLSAIARYFDSGHRSDMAEENDLKHRIGMLMATNADECPDENQSLLLDLLIDLRFALGIGCTTKAARL